MARLAGGRDTMAGEGPGSRMNPDDHVCLCHRVSQRKLVNFMRRTEPRVASQLSECLGAGTGCHWCVPFLEDLFCQWKAGEEPGLDEAPEAYAARRQRYRTTGAREGDTPPSS